MACVRRCRVGILALLFIIFAGSLALWTAAGQPPAAARFSAAGVNEGAWGVTGEYDLHDVQGEPRVRCDDYPGPFPGYVDILVGGPSASIAPNRDAQNISVRVLLFHVLPGDQTEDVAQSEAVVRGVTASAPWTSFPDVAFGGLPIGPHYIVAFELSWYGPDGATVEGSVVAQLEHHRSRLITDTGPIRVLEDTACRPYALPLAATTADRGTVNSWLSFNLFYFPIDVPLQARWDSRALDPVQTDDRGEVHSRLRVPAAPMGPHTIRWFTGDWTVSETFTVVPRIKVIPGTVGRGQVVDISLRGYGAREVVRIRWKNGASWVEIGRVTTSGTGSANIDLAVPAWAADGANSVRGDAVASGGGRAQTNAVDVLPAGTIEVSPERGTVNSRVTATLTDFPPNQAVVVTFHGFYEATANGMTNEDGRAVLTLRLPASPIGPHEIEATGGTTATAPFEIAPRIKLTPASASRGDEIGVSLRGFGARETVRIRWKRDGRFEQIATVTTSSSGSANLTVEVPAWAEDGPASVRGDGAIARAQTNAFVVAGGELADAAVAPTPTPSATLTAEATPSADMPSPTAAATVTPTPSLTVEPTPQLTISPTETPTAEVTATPEPTPMETPSTPTADGET